MRRWRPSELAHLSAHVVSWDGHVGTDTKVVTARVLKPVHSKYGVRTDPVGKLERTCDGILFGSKHECSRYRDLKLLEQAGVIRALKVHTRWPLELHGVQLCDYVDDFNYVDVASGGSLVVEDAKGVRTPLFVLKQRLMKAIHGIEVREVT